MQNFLSLYSKIENPTFQMVFFTFLLAFICSSLIALTYYFSTPKTLKTPNFIQALILSSVIATMILQSIGDNVASGLGILGALTIINFRTSFRDPRDIIFMFAALGVGIACGSYVFTIAITGTSIFCFIAFALKFTPFYLGDHLIWELRIRLSEKEDLAEAEKILAHYCVRCNLEAIRNDAAKEATPYHEREYVVILKDDKKQKEFLEKLENAGIYIRRFNLQNSDMTTQN
jgi:uncharacterized membrane protein YhiD involved in acid resistance